MKKILSVTKRSCDIIIPVWNQVQATKDCLEHIIRNTNYPYKIIIIDNGSDSKTKDFLKQFKKEHSDSVNLITNVYNLGFVKAVNQGLKISTAPYVCILNNDTMPAEGWLASLIKFSETHKDAGLLNPLCKGHIARKMSINEYARTISPNTDQYMEMNQCQGFCMLIKREVIGKIGYLDERFGIGGFDDTDYSMRAHRTGYRSVCVYSSYVYHKEHKSFDKMGERKKIQAVSEKEYFKKWARHLRIAVIFSIKNKMSNQEITNFLNASLFLAREWCWMNLLIFGDKFIKRRVGQLKQNLNFPVHQNIKFNYLKNSVKFLEITVRILERAFGSKKRKKYDAVIYNESRLSALLNILCIFQKCVIELVDFSHYSESVLKNIIKPFRGVTEQDMKCDIILPVCNQYEFTKRCIDSIIKNTDTPYRLIVINNGDNADTKKFLEELRGNKNVELTIVTNDYNIGWVKALNKGIDLSTAPYICFQNDDTIVTHGWLRKMINILNLQENFVMINPTWEGKPTSISIDRYNSILEKKAWNRFIETDWCRGFSTVIKRSLIEKIGHVDEIYGLAYFDDADYSVRAIEAGFMALRALDTYVYHHRNVTFFEILKGHKWNELHEKNKLIYYKKWGKPLRIAIILNNEACKNRHILDGIEDTVFYLARKQHHINLWSPCKFDNRFQHTNVKVKVFHPFLLKLALSLNLYTNRRRKAEKRYNIVFNYERKIENQDFNRFVKETVDNMKEETKEAINVNM